MRSSKYHDYSGFKVALFVVLVILGLIFYHQFLRPSLQHKAGETVEEIVTPPTCVQEGLKEIVTYCSECGEEMSRVPESIKIVDCVAGDVVIENSNESTCTTQGSYDTVRYCKVCNNEVSRDTTTLPLEPHNPGDVQIEPGKTETHTQPGNYYNVKYCTECDIQLEKKTVTVPAKGHSYNWELNYDSEKGEFTMVGTCDCTESGNVKTFTEKNGLKISVDNTIPSCCRKIMIGTVTVNGITVTETIELEPDSHSFAEPGLLDGEEVTVYFPVSDYAKWDDEYGVYYIHDADRFFFLDFEGNEWDENGFAVGGYKCDYCMNEYCTECFEGNYVYVVRIYNPKYDTRLDK